MRSIFVMVMLLTSTVAAQDSVYKNTLPADPPYYRVRYEASAVEGELIYPASYTVWIPPAVKVLRGVIVHQHGCGEGSCKSGLTGAYDLHWQALAMKHDYALLAPVIEQPEKADCQKWCDPRNGSDAVFQRALVDLGKLSGHQEMATVPWAIWGHSGGGHWAGGMVLLHPDRVAAAWLRSGVPPLTAAEGKPKPYEIPDAACRVPMMCNLGTLEGVTDKEGRFSGVWPGVEAFAKKLRSQNALLGISIDPISSHDCGNQRYLAMPWFDACLTARLSKTSSSKLNEISASEEWIAMLIAGAKEIDKPVPANEFKGELETSVWLPNKAIAMAWTQYSTDTAVQDLTPPPAPEELVVSGAELKWSAMADLESGLAGFIIERDGELLAKLPEQPKNPFGRPIFQNLSYSDTPTQPIMEMKHTDISPVAGKRPIGIASFPSTPLEPSQKKPPSSLHKMMAAAFSPVWNRSGLNWGVGLDSVGKAAETAVQFRFTVSIQTQVRQGGRRVLVRTIRRRLVSLFAVALMLMTGMAVIGIYGLVWHQEAVDDLDFLLHRSPNQEHLSRAISRISEVLHNSLDLRKEQAVSELKHAYLEHVQDAETELFDFRRRIEALPLTAELTMRQRDQVLFRLDKIYSEIHTLRQLSRNLVPISGASNTEMEALRFDVGGAVTRAQKGLETLPAYQTKNWVVLSLEKERRRSARMLQFLSWGIVAVGVTFVGILTCSFRWISMPLRKIAQGCTRIANGDIAHRLPPVSNWQDEFADLVAGVNCVADRFQQAEEELLHKVKERSEQLVRSQKLANVGFLAAGVAHEINNPLSAISMAAESMEFRLYDLIGLQSQDAREIMDRVAMIRRESRRCGDITARLLDFSRGEKAGRLPSDIAELVREVLVIVHHLGQFQDRLIDFECHQSVIAEVNSAQVKQVILNLVANALQATKPGGTVRIKLQEMVDSLVLSITDDGCGMDQETLQHVFDPFFTTRETGQGTGLGLSITHRIIEDHGGTVTPMSDGIGHGSTFQIRLPRRQSQKSAA